MRRVAVLLAIALFAAALIGFAVWDRYHVTDSEMFEFEGLAGPYAATTISEPVATDWREFSRGAPSRLAILLTDPDSAWLGLAHGLETIGVPFSITDDVERATAHRVVLVYPRISGRVLPAEALRSLASFAQRGGTLIGVNVLGGLKEVFGFEEVESHHHHRRIRFDTDDALAAEFTDPQEREIRIARHHDTRFGTRAYLGLRSAPLAVYEDGKAAITRDSHGSGSVYAFGFDIGSLLERSYSRRTEGVSASYANRFEPSLDVLLRLLERMYRTGDPDAVTLGTVPSGRSLAVMLSHDIDYSHSIVNAVEYARHARQRGFAGTHFLQTKYVRDWNDDIFFDADNLAGLEALRALDMELASHSVSHSLDFDLFPIGTGDERYPDYRPFVKNANRTYGGTVLGELRVSKFLIESLAEDTEVLTFRPGHLENLPTLPQTLAATGYRYSSSVTANASLTHLPFRLNHGRGSDSQVDVFEFPITVEDELDPPMLGRVAEAIELAEKIARYGGIFVVLIHPDIVGQKLEFQKRFVEGVEDLAWFGSIGEFGDWWAARDATAVDVRVDGDARWLEIETPAALRGLTLKLPPGSTPELPPEVRGSYDSGRLLVDLPAGLTRIELLPAPGARPAWR